MSSHIQVWMLVTLSVVAADYTYYIPQLVPTSLQGRLTTTTFTLESPKCLFKQMSTNTVWLLVANKIVDTTKLTIPAPYSSFASNGYYLTLNATESSYNCDNNASYIRVGSDTSCSTPNTCNGPLASTGKYIVKFVVLDINNKIVDETGWSGVITLRQGKASSVIDTWPGRRSGGMIVLTSILSVLLAFILVGLIGAFILGSKHVKPDTVAPPVATKNYETHYASEKKNTYSEPLN
ncbi:uroplakin-3b-like [Engystomops pustulosus]|uniref:uroplakin-3b-like n=1 Tax=Engystomops pustulosus TaxID=76066 RepID=UPI003AFB1E70